MVIRGKRHTGAFVGTRELMSAINVRSNERLQAFLSDLAQPIEAIRIEVLQIETRKVTILWLQTLPEMSDAALDEDYQELPYGADPRTAIADTMLAFWYREYKKVHRRAYESRDKSTDERERRAFRRCIRSIVGGAEDEERVRVLIDTFLHGAVLHGKQRVKINLKRSSKYREHRATLFTFVKVLPSLGRQIEERMREVTHLIDLPPQLLRTEGERRLAVNRKIRGWMIGHRYKYERGELPTLKQFPPKAVIDAWRRDEDLPSLDFDEDHGLSLLDVGDDSFDSDVAPPGFDEDAEDLQD